MSIRVPDCLQPNPKGWLLAFLILSVIATGIFGVGFILGLEQRMTLERSADGSFRVTRTNYFAGRLFFPKTIEGVTEVVMGSAKRDWRSDSQRERQRRARQRHLDLYGTNGSRVGWDREDDQRAIEDFMRGQEPSLSLIDAPPRWRMIASWSCVGFAALIFVGAIQSNFFPTKSQVRGLP